MNQEDTLKRSTELLDEEGVVFLEERCSAEVVARILEVARKESGDVQAALGAGDIGIGSAAGYEEIVQRSPGRWDVPITPQQFGVDENTLPWASLVRSALGEDAERSFSGVVFSDPGSPAQFWHIDSPHEAPEHLPPHALNVLVALQDIPLEMGPTEFARGSHRLTNHLGNPALDRDEMVYQHETTNPAQLVRESGAPEPEPLMRALPAGAFVVFDDRLMHRGSANRSESTRYVGYFSYRRKGYAENTHFEATRSVHDQ